MRLIDATALHRELVVEMVKCLRMSEETKGSMAERVLNKVDEAPTIEAEPANATDTNVGRKWIPVTERLPEPFVSVLVQMPGERPFPTVREGFITKDGTWHSALYDREPDEVTHWMPLPEPPKDGGAE